MIAHGRVRGTHGGLLHIDIPTAKLGANVTIEAEPFPIGGTICALADGGGYVAAHGALDGIRAGTHVRMDPTLDGMALGSCALGRAIDACGSALDGGRRVRGRAVPVAHEAPLPRERAPVRFPLWTGVRAIDGLLTIGAGARVGIFGPPGAGKSSLLEMLVRGVCADAVVIALVGERGREAERWIAACDARTTIVCATSDRPAAERLRAADVAMAHAHALRRRG